ncbi:MAG: tRNA (adenosine(37)-N6)-threonylcarbamoyltransferase complex dimerization subunit type 1 TsaB [Rhizobiaceae bacterium]|nr:tRNA (adenosine(37)-N6)-threonylcarbamoyltransferase complex dimerization subunit type 1 TsaB [Rhizobiaceae bacterium]
MIFLALDTASHLCAAALYDDVGGTILGEVSEDIGRGHAELLMDVIGECFKQASLEYSDLGKVICTIGPGSFTGVRVGLSTARGIALGLSIPVIGVSTLVALAHEADAAGSLTGSLATILDARREEAYVHWNDTAQVMRYDALDTFFGDHEFELCGSGAREFLNHTTKPHKILHELAAAPIATIARLGARMIENAAPPEPLYLRAPDAKPQLGFTLGQ